jgi:hypothetical protein
MAQCTRPKLVVLTSRVGVDDEAALVSAKRSNCGFDLSIAADAQITPTYIVELQPTSSEYSRAQSPPTCRCFVCTRLFRSTRIRRLSYNNANSVAQRHGLGRYAPSPLDPRV